MVRLWLIKHLVSREELEDAWRAIRSTPLSSSCPSLQDFFCLAESTSFFRYERRGVPLGFFWAFPDSDACWKFGACALPHAPTPYLEDIRRVIRFLLVHTRAAVLVAEVRRMKSDRIGRILLHFHFYQAGCIPRYYGRESMVIFYRLSNTDDGDIETLS